MHSAGRIRAGHGERRGGTSSFPVSFQRIIVDNVLYTQTDRARKKLDAEGPAAQPLRTIPFFQPPSGTRHVSAISVEATP